MEKEEVKFSSEEVSPSNYGRNGKDGKEVLASFMKLTVERSEEARKNIKHELNIKYAELPNNHIDVFYPSNYNQETPLAVFFHGGYWQECSNIEHHHIATPLTDKGLITIFVDTQNAPDATLTAIIQQCCQAMSLIARKFPDTSKVSLFGHSSGGHKAAMVVSTCHTDDQILDDFLTKKLATVAYICGVFEVTHLIGTSINDAVKMDRTEAEHNSPILLTSTLVDNLKKWTKMKFLLINSENDAVSIKHWNKEYQTKLESLSIPYESEVIEGHDHFSIIEDLSEKDFALSKILIRNFS